jgi:branched-chain amino acid transport system ATP-binding protein
MLLIEGVRSGYGNSEVLNGVTMRVPDGKVTILVGPNGAGKSTLMKTIMNLVRPTSGKILLDQTEITHAGTQEILKRGIAYVSQGAGVFPSMTVLENIMMGRYVKTKDEWRSEIAAALEMFPVLKDRKNQKAGFLSGGERQMLAIARSLIAAPHCLLLDEPSLGLDIGKQQLVFNKLKELNSKGLTILLAEQNLTAAKVADHSYVLNHGTIKYEGSPSIFEDGRAVSELFFGTGKKEAVS